MREQVLAAIAEEVAAIVGLSERERSASRQRSKGKGRGSRESQSARLQEAFNPPGHMAYRGWSDFS